MDDEDLFHLALGKPADERASFLDRECAGEITRRRRIEVLLRSHETPDSFLAVPAVGPGVMASLDQGLTTVLGPGRSDEELTSRSSPTEGPGSHIGPYKLLEQLGEGGMGTVYMAEQVQPVRRKAALKVIKPGMDSRQIIARFEAERQALALMDHVNIARVIDAGTTDSGRPYFVMELVHGVPITEYCDENHLTPRQRLELFVPVCRAIQHAHQKGIIHRDIKPSNVMVTLYDGKPVPKVIDFGVAKAIEQRLTDRTLFTHYGTLVGTLEYMSPEQAEMSALGADTRSDIYSLGVLLYELLTGTTPFDKERFQKAAYDEIRRIIREEDPPRPSTRLSELGRSAVPRRAGVAGPASNLASVSASRHTEPAKLTKLFRGEVDWIVMRALNKDRDRRYETANGFAADVQRYLADEPVQACPPSASYRLRKFARRNKRGLASAALLTLTVLAVAGSLGWTVRDRGARAREREAREAAIRAGCNMALGEAGRWQEQEKWPEALSAVRRAEGFLAGSGDDELHGRVLRLRKDLEMVLRLEEVRLVASEWKDDSFDTETKDDRFGTEAADRSYAAAFADYGIDVAGLTAEQATARIRERAGVAVALASAMDDWAFIRSKRDKAGGLALTALAQATDPDPWRRQVRQAARRENIKAVAILADSQEVLHQPPSNLLALARSLQAVGLADAEINVLRRAQRQYPGDFWVNFGLGRALYRLGSPHRDEAISFYRAALAVRPRSAAVHNQLGNALQDQKKLDEAIAIYRNAVGINPKFAIAHNNLAIALCAQDKLDETIVALRDAVRMEPNNIGRRNRLTMALVYVARQLITSQDPQARNPGRALELAKEAQATYFAVPADARIGMGGMNITAFFHWNVTRGSVDLMGYGWADIYPGNGMYVDLDGSTRGAARLESKALFTLHAGTYELRFDLGNNGGGAPAPNSARVTLGSLFDEAFERVGTIPLETVVRTITVTDPTSARLVFDHTGGDYAGLVVDNVRLTGHGPARVLLDDDFNSDAVVEMERRVLNTLGAAHYRTGDWKGAIAALERSMAVRNGGDGSVWFFLAMAHWRLGNEAVARRWFGEAVAWMDKNQPKNEELRRFRAEAEALLKFTDEKPATQPGSN